MKKVINKTFKWNIFIKLLFINWYCAVKLGAILYTSLIAIKFVIAKVSADFIYMIKW